MKPILVINNTQSLNKLKVNITVIDHEIIEIKDAYVYTVGGTSFISMLVNAKDDILIGAEGQSIEFRAPIDKNISIILPEDDSYKYELDTYQVDTSQEDYDMVIDLSIKRGASSYCEPINKINPFLMYYRKLLPYNRYAIYALFENEISYLGIIEKITYDTDLKKYKLYSPQGVILLFDDLPLVKPSKVFVQGTTYTNPPTAIWIFDTQNLDDLMFVNQVKLKSVLIKDDEYSNFSDWVIDFNNDILNIQKISIEVRSVNQRIWVDFNTFSTLNPKEFIREITETDVITMKFPFKDLYFKLDEKYTITRIIINYNDDKLIQLDGNFIAETKGIQ